MTLDKDQIWVDDEDLVFFKVGIQNAIAKVFDDINDNIDIDVGGEPGEFVVTCSSDDGFCTDDDSLSMISAKVSILQEKVAEGITDNIGIEKDGLVGADKAACWVEFFESMAKHVRQSVDDRIDHCNKIIARGRT